MSLGAHPLHSRPKSVNQFSTNWWRITGCLRILYSRYLIAPLWVFIESYSVLQEMRDHIYFFLKKKIILKSVAALLWFMSTFLSWSSSGGNMSYTRLSLWVCTWWSVWKVWKIIKSYRTNRPKMQGKFYFNVFSLLNSQLLPFLGENIVISCSSLIQRSTLSFFMSLGLPKYPTCTWYRPFVSRATLIKREIGRIYWCYVGSWLVEPKCCSINKCMAEGGLETALHHKGSKMGGSCTTWKI